ncbi:hypothetical protein BKK54_10355 [Rodentibacter genomosp. 1]|uniref:Uncharacterized protein n=2 Tax=Rodentibacter genomosp. 1 TaxID=1908264 RepID=A0A1V3J1F2_9PAST|nr:hypothetical protein BKK54_10355 [Rodentibacter genomosp. 1]
MKQSTPHLEMAKELLLNEQNGYPKNLKLVEIKDSLSDFDKERIKQVVLESVAKNTVGYTPVELAESACKAIYLIDSYKH